MQKNFCYKELSHATFAVEYFWLTWTKGKFQGSFADKYAFGIAFGRVGE